MNKTQAQADADGIEMYYDPNKGYRGVRGVTMYKIPCAMCGDKYVIKPFYRRDITYLCDYCNKVVKEKKKAKLEEEIKDVQTKAEKRFEQAIANIHKQVKDFSKYDKAIEIARTRLERYDSVPEAMVAIELLKLKYKIIPQQKIRKYKVDFVLPDIKMVIEVDGSIYHKNKTKQQERDVAIQYALGMNWEIIHIPAGLIKNDIEKVKDAISVFYK